MERYAGLPDSLPATRKEYPMNGSQNASALRSKQEIMDALLSLMEKSPYNEISVKQIVLETGLVRKTFYRNFTSKDDVLDAYINSVIREYVDGLLEQPEDPLGVIFRFCEKNRKMLKLMNRNRLLYLLLLRLNEEIPRLSSTVDMNRNPFARLMAGMESDYLIAFNIGAIWNVICKWVERGMEEPLDDVRSTLETYLRRVSQGV